MKRKAKPAHPRRMKPGYGKGYSGRGATAEQYRAWKDAREAEIAKAEKRRLATADMVVAAVAAPESKQETA